MTVCGAQSGPRVVDEHTRRLCERARRFEDDADPFVRGLIATRVYRDRADLPAVRKRAEVLAGVLEQVEPIVLAEERIVGAAYRRRRVHQGVSDAHAWRVRVAHPERHGCRDDWPMPEHVRREMRWWRGRALNVHARNPVRRRNAWLQRHALAHPHGLVGGHTLPDHGILLGAGIAELRRRIADRLAGSSDAARRDQWRAMDRCLEGLAAHCRRCAAAARRKADEVADPHLKSRLAAAGDDCEALADDAPASFAQALQLLYFSNFADLADNPGDAASFGRIDQLLAPFYERDLTRGALCERDAFDLVCGFVIKRWCSQASINMTVGGVDASGRDATNDLSVLFLEAMEATEMVTDMTVRLHRGAGPRFVRTVARVVRRGFGRPSLYNDDVAIDALVRHGVAIEDARDYAPLGCVEVMLPGRTAGRTMCMGLNLAKVLELVLNRGRCAIDGEVVFDGVPNDFPSFDELVAELHERVRGIADVGVEIIRADERIEPTVFPRPWLTVLSRGGIDSGVDVTAGQPKYDPVGVTLDGLADAANSLLAVRRLAYEQRRLTLDELRDVLADDWQGHDELRRYVLNRCPRFGQDNAEVDALAAAEAEHFARCFEGRRTEYGGQFWPMIFGVSTGLIAGKAPRTAAGACGRRRGEALAMSLQPSPAGPRGCITEVLRSAAAVDFRRFPGGVSNVQECDPSHVAGADGLDRLVDLIRGYFELGGMELSLNFLDAATLREAQADPHRHASLMVRLFGLSAQFVCLSPSVQDSVIERVAAAEGRGQAGGAGRERA